MNILINKEINQFISSILWIETIKLTCAWEVWVLLETKGNGWMDLFCSYNSFGIFQRYSYAFTDFMFEHFLISWCNLQIIFQILVGRVLNHACNTFLSFPKFLLRCTLTSLQWLMAWGVVGLIFVKLLMWWKYGMGVGFGGWMMIWRGIEGLILCRIGLGKGLGNGLKD